MWKIKTDDMAVEKKQSWEVLVCKYVLCPYADLKKRFSANKKEKKV